MLILEIFKSTTDATEVDQKNKYLGNQDVILEENKALLFCIQ